MEDTLKIFVVCSYALSSSMLAERMQEYANENSISVEVTFMTPEKLKENLAKCDVVLLSPQVRFNKSVFQELLEPFGVPVVTIPMEIYGLMDAEKAIDFSVRTFKEFGGEGED